jgi:hypothetical protein
MYDTEYKTWMREVKKRDQWSCRLADSTCEGRIEAHHILPWSEFPEYRYELTNGISLCHRHHPRTRTDEMEMVMALQELVANAD